MNRERRIFPDPEAACEALAQDFVTTVACALEKAARFTVALAGGSTPGRFYRLLARTPYRERLAWERLHVFFGDERFVPPDHPDSNYRMARETLLDHVPIPAANVHPMPTLGLTLPAAARRYESHLLECFAGPPRLDWVLLGLGEDGHTASLFPGFEPPPEAWVAAVASAPKPPPRRLTLTYRTFNQARQAVFLATGPGKAEIVARVFTRPELNLPAQRISPRERLSWYLDEAASAHLTT